VALKSCVFQRSSYSSLVFSMVAGFLVKVYIQGTSRPFPGTADRSLPLLGLSCLRKNHTTFEINLGIWPSVKIHLVITESLLWTWLTIN